MNKISAILALCVTSPIWYYLLFKVLSAVNASELMWFLFWIYVPASVLAQVIAKIASE